MDHRVVQGHRGTRLLALGALGLGALTVVGACGADAAGTGTVTFTSWGEEYIEQAIPAEAFADGYSVEYDRFLVLIGNVRVAEGGAEAAAHDGFFLVDHTEPGTKELVRFEGLEAGDYTEVSYEVSPAPRDAITLVGGVTDEDASRMADGGYHLWVEGRLVKGAEEKSFAWGFGIASSLEDCKGERDGREVLGVVVTSGGDDVVELTIHGDHLFYDDLQSAAAELRGEALWNADVDADGEITQAELTAVRLVELPADQYGTGGAPDVDDLGAFVAFLSRTVGHFRGEGECFLTDP